MSAMSPGMIWSYNVAFALLKSAADGVEVKMLCLTGSGCEPCLSLFFLSVFSPIKSLSYLEIKKHFC